MTPNVIWLVNLVITKKLVITITLYNILIEGSMNYEELEKKVNTFFFVRVMILNVHLQFNSIIYNLVSHLLETFQLNLINDNYF